MRGSTQRRMVWLAIALSVSLTGLTVWAVDRQGKALLERERADLANAARAAAAERMAEFRADLQRAFGAAGAALEASGVDGLDEWVVGQRRWMLAGYLHSSAAWHVFPRTPLEQGLPAPPRADEDGTEQRDPARASEHYLSLAQSEEPATRAAALMAAAASEQERGHYVGASQLYTEAAQVLRSVPSLSRFAFQADVAQIESLLAAGDRASARESLARLVARLHAGHPGRLGRAEIVRLREPARILAFPPDDSVSMQLAALEQRAQRRWELSAAAERRMRQRLGEPGALADFAETLTARSDELLIMGVRRMGEEGWLVLVSPASDLLRQYWQAPSVDPRWRVVLLEQHSDEPVLVRLGREFGRAVLQPSPLAIERLESVERRRVGLVAVTAAGSAGAWTLVIWVLGRVIARQRELVRLQRRFVADVSHELKTPLALIRLLAETLADQRVRDPERVQNYLATITRESERLSVLLDSILDFSRLESGRKEYHLGDCDITAVARQAWALFEPQFNSAGFEARLELADELPRIRADAQALQQVMVNLLQNAYRYAGDGKFVRLSVVRDGYLIVITVEDHGIGMSRKQLDRLGDSFVRGDDTRVRQMRGAGLGLAIVNHIVAAHRGKLEVQSQPGKGSTFTVWIPYQPPVSPEA